MKVKGSYGDENIRAKRQQEERALQIGVKSYYDYAFNPNEVVMFMIPNGVWLGGDEKARMIQMGLMKKMGFQVGASDLIWLWAGGYGFMELKAPGAKITPGGTQELFGARVVGVGAKFVACDSLEGVERAVLSWGLKPKCRIAAVAENTRQQMRQNLAFELFKPLPKIGG